MRLGLWAINFGACADPELQVRAAVAAEGAGFESIWTSEHVAMPIRDNPVPMPPETPFLDSIVSLANMAAHTSRLRLGTGILVMPHHNPVLLAKALATLDLVSGGRLIAGFAGGYVEAEFRALGVSFKERGAITDEYLQAIRVLWTEEVPRFAGRFAAFDGIRFELGRGAEPLEISLTTFEPLTPELVERATEVGIDRLIVMPTVPGDRLEATVRALGARFASGPPGRQPSDQSE